MTMYRLCLLGITGGITAVQRFHADTDKEALGHARSMVNRQWELMGFELWEGRRKVSAESSKREPEGVME